MKKRSLIFCSLCALILTLGSFNALADDYNEEEEIETFGAFIELMDNYLTVSDKWVNLVSTKEATVFFVVERIVEIHEEEGDSRKAIPDLRKILTSYQDNSTVRNFVHFKIAEIYKESGQSAKAINELYTLLEMNRDG